MRIRNHSSFMIRVLLMQTLSRTKRERLYHSTGINTSSLIIATVVHSSIRLDWYSVLIYLEASRRKQITDDNAQDLIVQPSLLWKSPDKYRLTRRIPTLNSLLIGRKLHTLLTEPDIGHFFFPVLRNHERTIKSDRQHDIIAVF